MLITLFNNANQTFLKNIKENKYNQKVRKSPESKRDVFSSSQISFANCSNEKGIKILLKRAIEKKVNPIAQLTQEFFYKKNGEIDFIFKAPKENEKELVYKNTDGTRNFLVRYDKKTLRKQLEIFFKKNKNKKETVDFAIVHEYDSTGRKILEKRYEGNIKAEEIKYDPLFGLPLKA